MKLQGKLQIIRAGYKSSKKVTLMLTTAIVICLSGCNVSNDEGSFTEDVQMNIKTSEATFADAGLSDKCPVVTGEDVAGGGGPHVINFLLRKAEGLLLPAVQAVSGHFQIKLCRTLTEKYQFEWNLRINNKDGFEYTGWALVNADTEEELLGAQFSNKIASGRMVHQNGILEVNPELVIGPSDLRIVVRTTNTEVNLVGLLLPAVQSGKN